MYPEDAKYTKDHEWVRKSGDFYAVGITQYAADQLGDITFVDLPAVDAQLAKGAEAASVESVKAASDIYCPLAGTVAEINEALEDQPELVNNSPYDDGWFFKLSGVDETELDLLMSAEAYVALIAEHEE